MFRRWPSSERSPEPGSNTHNGVCLRCSTSVESSSSGHKTCARTSPLVLKHKRFQTLTLGVSAVADKEDLPDSHNLLLLLLLLLPWEINTSYSSASALTRPLPRQFLNHLNSSWWSRWKKQLHIEITQHVIAGPTVLITCCRSCWLNIYKNNNNYNAFWMCFSSRVSSPGMCTRPSPLHHPSLIAQPLMSIKWCSADTPSCPFTCSRNIDTLAIFKILPSNPPV